MAEGFPYLRPGMRVGLLGGSFDPPHEGHAHITCAALRAFGLDRVWWLVSPGNPLKSRGPAPMAQRMQAAARVMRHPRVQITDVEARLGTQVTADTLAALQRRYPGVRFVWLMGADNLAGVHHWANWQAIFQSVPVGVLARPGDRISARLSPAARLYRRARVDGPASHLLGQMAAPAWCYVNVPLVAQSSTALRRGGQWGRSWDAAE